MDVECGSNANVRQIGDGFKKTLANFAVPRVSGTDGNKKVREYIRNRMSDLGWTVELDSFEDETPYGRKWFHNIIATNNDKICNRIVIACHYDSKYFSYNFIGATDSAVPCALLIHLAAELKAKLVSHRNANIDPTLQFIFFDGEEAFKDWNDYDSLYGSRHLADKWLNQRLTDSETHLKNCNKNYEIQRISVLILLDLIGASNMRFTNFFANTKHLFVKLMDLEKKYISKNKLFVSSNVIPSYIEDDHIPFMKNNVPCLHLISTPFPKAWHKKTDDINHLDFQNINLFSNIFSDFLKDILNVKQKNSF